MCCHGPPRRPSGVRPTRPTFAAGVGAIRRPSVRSIHADAAERSHRAIRSSHARASPTISRAPSPHRLVDEAGWGKIPVAVGTRALGRARGVHARTLRRRQGGLECVDGGQLSTLCLLLCSLCAVQGSLYSRASSPYSLLPTLYFSTLVLIRSLLLPHLLLIVPVLLLSLKPFLFISLLLALALRL